MANGSQITIHSGDVGTIIKGTAKTRSNGTDTLIDLNDCSSVIITLRDPDGNATTHTATAVNADGGTDGIWKITTTTAIFADNPGFWQVQAKYAFATGNIFYSNIKTINIGDVVV